MAILYIENTTVTGKDRHQASISECYTFQIVKCVIREKNRSIESRFPCAVTVVLLPLCGTFFRYVCASKQKIKHQRKQKK